MLGSRLKVLNTFVLPSKCKGSIANKLFTYIVIQLEYFISLYLDFNGPLPSHGHTYLTLHTLLSSYINTLNVTEMNFENLT